MKRLLPTVTLSIIVLFVFSCKDDTQVDSFYNDTAFSHSGEYPDSVIHYATISLSKQLGNVSDYYSHLLIARSYQKKRDYRNAFDNYLLARDLVPDESKYDYERCVIYNSLGKICKMHTNYDLAIENYEKALEYASQEELPTIYYNLGNAHKSKEQMEEATEAYLMGKDYALINDDLVYQAKIHHELGRLYLELDDADNARSHFLTIINYDQNTTAAYQRYQGMAMHNMGDSYMREKDYATAIDYFTKALVIKKGSQNFITFMDLGTCYDQLGEHDKAIEYYQQATTLFSQVEPYKEHIEVFKKINQSYRLNGELKESLIASDKYIVELEEFTANKEFQAQTYAAAQIQARLELHDKWAFANLLFREYKNWIWVLGTALVLLGIWGGFQYRKYFTIRKRQKEIDKTAQEVYDDISALLRDR